MDLKKFYKNKKILITGGLGFIGSNTAIKLVEIGANVTIIDSLDKNCGGNEFNINCIKNKVIVIKEDIRNVKIIKQAIKGKDIIFNLAGHLSHKRSMEQPLVDFNLNTLSSLSLLDACKKNGQSIKIVYTGTRGQYGKIINKLVDESHPNNFIDVNGISKYTAEQLHFLYHNSYPYIKVTSARLTNCYGPRHQMVDSSQGFIGSFIRQAIDDKVIEVWAGNQIRDFNFIDDIVDLLLLLGMANESEGEAFNIGSGREISIRELATTIIDICGSGKIKVKDMPKHYRKIDIGCYKANISKIKNIIGWEPKKEIKEGINETIKFYKKYKKMYW